MPAQQAIISKAAVQLVKAPAMLILHFCPWVNASNGFVYSLPHFVSPYLFTTI